MEHSNDISKCPFHQNQKGLSDGVKNQDWWPKALNLDILHQQDSKLIHLERILIMPKNSKNWIYKL